MCLARCSSQFEACVIQAGHVKSHTGSLLQLESLAIVLRLEEFLRTATEKSRFLIYLVLSVLGLFNRNRGRNHVHSSIFLVESRHF
jgi:ABC-type sulfate transport system permease component